MQKYQNASLGLTKKNHGSSIKNYLSGNDSDPLGFILASEIALSLDSLGNANEFLMKAIDLDKANEEFRKKLLDRRWKNKDIIEACQIPKKLDIKFSVNSITGFPTETRKLAFDTIELNRNFDADNTNIVTFVPFHGTPLRKMCEELGYIKPETITKCLNDDNTSLNMPQYTPDEIKEKQLGG